MFQEEDSFDFRPLLNFDGFLLILSLSILLMWSVDRVFLSRISRKYVAGCKPLVTHVCSLIHEQLKRDKLCFLGASWAAWTLDLISVQKIHAWVCRCALCDDPTMTDTFHVREMKHVPPV